jgi:hypothetical protein
MHRQFAFAALALAALGIAPLTAAAEMGPCRPDNQGFVTCGAGDGAARAIAKTISPSKRLAFAWRLTNRPPTSTPDENDPDLENLIVRIRDGAVLAKSRGSYWDLGTKIAKAYIFTVWSPDSRLLIKVEQRAERSSAELFSFAEDDAGIGPFELVSVIGLAVRAKMQDPKNMDNYVLVFPAHPEMTVDNQGLIHAVVIAKDTSDRIYDVTLQVARPGGSLSANVVSILPHSGVTISIIVH